MPEPCVSCGNATRPWLTMPIDAKTFAPTPFGSVSRCENCGHGSVFPLPRVEDVPQFYALEKYYTQGTPHIPNVPRRLHDRVLTKLAWMFDGGVDLQVALDKRDLPEHSKVCEIGCGHAENLLQLKAAGHAVIGVDPDPKAIVQAAKNGIEVLVGTGEELPEGLAAGGFDLVIMSHSLEHCIDPALAVRNVARLLRPGGAFVCEVPNAGCRHFLWNNVCSEMFDAPRHLHFYNIESLRMAIENTGMIVESVQYTGFTRHHSPGWRLTEQRIREHLLKTGADCPPKHTFLRSLLLWFATFAAPAPVKYDSVRIAAVKRGPSLTV